MAILKVAQDQVSRRGAIEEHFFQSRTIVLTGEITHQLAQRICWPWLRQVTIRSI